MRRAVIGLVLFVAPLCPGACGGESATPPAVVDGGTRSAAREAGTSPEASVKASAVPELAFVGRFAAGADGAMSFGWPGTRIVARFSGAEVRARLEEKPAYGGPTELDVVVDGAATRLALAAGEKVYTLAKGLNAGEHVVTLVRRTEGQVGQTRFLGFDFAGGTLLAPPAARPRRIEFLGDSNTTGYGIEGGGPTCDFSASTQNFGKTWAALVADKLDADPIAIAYSGKGVLLNLDRADRTVFQQLYLRTVPETAEPAWDFARIVPDAVVVMLGANDYGKENDASTPPTLTAFKTRYAALLTFVREKYPGAHVFTVLTPTVTDDYPAGWSARTNLRNAFSQTVADRNRAGDARSYFVEVTPTATDDDLTACDYHPGLALHRRIADQVLAVMKQKTGW
jgi:lysophospholipase L1-like esterase